MNKAIFIILFGVVLSGFCTAQTEVVGDVSGNWDESGSPYLVVGNIRVAQSHILTVANNCSIIFINNSSLLVDKNATLEVNGYNPGGVVITALDTVLTSSSGGHGGITFYKSSRHCHIRHCKIEFGNALVRTFGYSRFPRLRSKATSRDNNSKNRLNSGYNLFEYNATENDSLIVDSVIFDLNCCRGYGGAICCINSNINFHYPFYELEIENCFALYGGGIAYLNSSSCLNRVRLADNRAISNGGGIYLRNSYLLDTYRVSFLHNISGNSGGALCMFNSGLELQFGWIDSNWANDLGGAIFLDQNSILDITETFITRNHSSFEGGAIYIRDSQIDATNLLIAENSANQGGALFIDNNSRIILINNTITNNSAETGKEIITTDNTKMVFFNSILWGNDSLSGGDIITNGISCPNCTLFIAFSEIDSTAVDHENIGTYYWDMGNISEDPVLATDWLYYFLYCPTDSSPCIDAGAECVVTPWAVTYTAPELEILGYERATRYIDMGVYESG